MEEPLSKYKAKIKEEGQRLKKLKEEIKNYRLEIKNYEYEIKRIVNDTEKLKKEWFKRLDEQGGFTNELLKQAEQQDNLEENQLAENENEHVDQEQDMGDGTGYDDENFKNNENNQSESSESSESNSKKIQEKNTAVKRYKSEKRRFRARNIKFTTNEENKSKKSDDKKDNKKKKKE